MNEFTYKIILADNTKRKVKGQQITEHFAADYHSGGWWITHLPSGKALVLSSFNTVEDAKNFAKGYEALFGDKLDGKGDIDIRAKKNTPEAALRKLTAILNKNPKIYSMPEIERLSKRIYDYA